MVSRCSWPAEWRGGLAGALLAAAAVLAGCGTPAKPTPPPPTSVIAPAPVRPVAPPEIPSGPNRGEEIIVAGRRIPVGTRVVTWLEPGGYNGYAGTAPPGPRNGHEKSRRDLAALQRTIDQFVLHYDGAGLSRVCFSVLQQRKLSVHFLLDVDGTIYQTIDAEDRAAHATISNDRSVGVEIANVGAYPPAEDKTLREWYARDRKRGGTVLTIPPRFHNPNIRTPNFVARPARPTVVRGTLQNKPLLQYDYTPEQYAALAKLTAALCRVFPRLACDFPRDAQGRLLSRQLTPKEWENFHGVLGHFHIQDNKIDPGPAFQWHEFLAAARRELK